MTDYKFTFLSNENKVATGNDGLKGSYGKIFDEHCFIVLYCVEGCAITEVNAKRRRFCKGNLIIICDSPSFIILKASSLFKIKYVAITYEITDELFRIVSEALWSFFNQDPILRLTLEYKIIFDGFFSQMEWIAKKVEGDRQLKMATNQAYNLLSMIATEAEKNMPEYSKKRPLQDRPTEISISFFHILLQNFHKNRNISFYAEKLCITQDYLYKVLQKTIGMSPKEIIIWRVIQEIKNLLRHTDHTLNMIAHELHFDDVSYMCRFFKKVTGMSPMEYKNQ